MQVFLLQVSIHVCKHTQTHTRILGTYLKVLAYFYLEAPVTKIYQFSDVSKAQKRIPLLAKDCVNNKHKEIMQLNMWCPTAHSHSQPD